MTNFYNRYSNLSCSSFTRILSIFCILHFAFPRQFFSGHGFSWRQFGELWKIIQRVGKFLGGKFTREKNNINGKFWQEKFVWWNELGKFCREQFVDAKNLSAENETSWEKFVDAKFIPTEPFLKWRSSPTQTSQTFQLSQTWDFSWRKLVEWRSSSAQTSQLSQTWDFSWRKFSRVKKFVGWKISKFSNFPKLGDLSRQKVLEWRSSSAKSCESWKFICHLNFVSGKFVGGKCGRVKKFVNGNNSDSNDFSRQKFLQQRSL